MTSGKWLRSSAACAGITVVGGNDLGNSGAAVLVDSAGPVINDCVFTGGVVRSLLSLSLLYFTGKCCIDWTCFSLFHAAGVGTQSYAKFFRQSQAYNQHTRYALAEIQYCLHSAPKEMSWGVLICRLKQTEVPW